MSLSFGEIQCFVSDLKAAKTFYRDTLGLNLIEETNAWLVFDIDRAKFIVMAGANPGTRRRVYGDERATVLCLKSDNIEKEYSKLTDRGVEFFSAINEVPQGKFVALQDPEGNLLEIIQK